MSRADYDRWVAAGRPFTLMRPARELRDRLRAHGYTVYDIGNTSHLLAEPPEDHTPYSATGWPNKASFGIGYAIDVMPPAAGATSRLDGLPLPSLQQLGARLLKDRNADVKGISWLKYMNWEPERDNGGACWHDSWQPNHARRSSTDRGHIHLSGVTGLESSDVGRGYDPVTEIRGGTVAIDAIERKIDQVIAMILDGRSPTGVQTVDGGKPRIALYAALHALTPTPGAEADAIVAGVLAGLTPERIAAAIPAELADELVAALGRRFAG